MGRKAENCQVLSLILKKVINYGTSLLCPEKKNIVGEGMQMTLEMESFLKNIFIS